MIEDRIRAMLRERAADITAPPSISLPEVRAPRRTTGLLVAAAAVVVLAVAGLVLAVRGGGGHERSGGACLPQQWQDTIDSSQLDLPADAEPLAISSNGTLLFRTDEPAVYAVTGPGEVRVLTTAPNTLITRPRWQSTTVTPSSSLAGC